MVFLVKGTYMLGRRTVDKDGNIVRITTFGDNAPKARYNKLNR